jgi:hypothetical protein
MADEIVNRVAQSALLTFDLEEHYPEGPRSEIDLAQWLYEGLILREKEFRAALKEVDWTPYQGHFVALYCSTDAIIPAWAYTLVCSTLIPFAKRVVLGRTEDLNASLYQDVLNELDFSSFADKAVILKGCSQKPVPPAAYLLAMDKLQAVAKKVMYGEACSAVPLYKR